MSESRQTFLSSDFAAQVEYEPRIKALEAENKALWDLLRRLHKGVMESDDLAKWIEEDRNTFDLSVAGYRAASITARLAYACYKAWNDGDDLRNPMGQLYEYLVASEAIEDLEGEEADVG